MRTMRIRRLKIGMIATVITLLYIRMVTALEATNPCTRLNQKVCVANYLYKCVKCGTELCSAEQVYDDCGQPQKCNILFAISCQTFNMKDPSQPTSTFRPGDRVLVVVKTGLPNNALCR